MGLSKGRGKLKQTGDELVIGDGSATGSATISKPAYTGNNDSDLTLPNVQTDVLVSRTSTDTITNKTIDGDDNTIQDVALSSLKTVLGDADKVLRRDASGDVVADNALPNSSQIVTLDSSDTLENKNIDIADGNTILNLADSAIATGAAIDATKIHDGSVDNTTFGYLAGVTSGIQGQIDNKIDAGNVDLTSDVTGELPIANGGTGQGTASAAFDALSPMTNEGDIIYGGASGAGTRLAKGTQHHVLKAGASVPEYGLITNDNVDNSAAIAWSKLDKTGSNLTDIATRSHTSLSDIGTNSHADIDIALSAAASHASNTSNPHSVTASQVGLGNVDNTSDATKNSAVATLQNKTLDAPIVDNTALFNEETTPATPSAGVVKLYPKSDGNFYKLASDGVETRVGGGSGSGSRNYLADWYDGVKSVGSVTSGITATGNITPSASWKASNATGFLTIANVTSGGLREGYSLKLDSVAAGAAFVQSPEFTLDLMDLGKPVTVSFDHQGTTANDDYQVYMVRYDSSGVYQEQIQIAGTASATSPFSARMASGGTSTYNKFQGFFISRSTSTDLYALRFYRNNASDTTDIMVDSLYIGPQSVVQGAAVTDWQSYTPSNTQGFGTITNSNLEWCQSGPNMFIRGYFTSGTVTANEAQIGLPNNKVIAGAGSASVPVGDLMRDSSITGITQTVLITPGDSFLNFGRMTAGAGTNNLTPVGGSTLVSSTERIAFFAGPIPIVGWSSNVTMADRAVEEYLSNTGSTTTAGSNNSAATSFYGLAGVPFISIASTTTTTSFTTFDITLPSPAQPTDCWKVEMRNPVNNVWVDAPRDSSANTARYGVFAEPTSSTNLRVYFGNAGASQRGATYGSAGQAWSDFASAGYYWRVRKVSGGANVGFPVSTANIVGRTESSVPASSMLGEFKTAIGTNVAMSSGVYTTVASIALTTGWWDLSADVCIDHGVATASNTTFAVLISDASDSTTAGNTEGCTFFLGNYLVSTAGNDMAFAMRRRAYCDGTNVYVYKTDSTYDTISGLTVAMRVFFGTFTVGSATASGCILATRVA